MRKKMRLNTSALIMAVLSTITRCAAAGLRHLIIDGIHYLADRDTRQLAEQAATAQRT
jgi:hypothetical protein